MSDGNSVKEGSGPTSLQRVDLHKTAMRRLQSEPARSIVVVLGMHRSGTSLLSNILHLLGVDMADTSDQASPKNAGGFWERPALVEIQDKVLEAIGRPIGKPSHLLPLPAAWWRRKEVQAVKPKLVAYLREQLQQAASPWGFKDPRTCRLLPLWWEVFREVNVEPIYLHAIRKPAESSVSMANKSKIRKISPATGELMWLSYNYDIVRHVTVKQQQLLLVDYDDWFDDAIGTAQRLVDALGIGGDLSQEEFEECVTSTVRGEYRHEVEDKENAARIPLSDMLYRTLTQDDARNSADVRQLRGQMRLIDLFFKSVRPLVENIDAAVAADAEEQEQQAEQESAAEQSLAEAQQRIAQLEDEKQRAEEKAAQLEQEHGAAQEQLKQLQEEQRRLGGQVNQLQEENTQLASLRDEHRASTEQLAQLKETYHCVQEQLAQLRDEHRRAIDEAACASAAASASEERAKQVEEERKRALEEMTSALHAASVAEKLARDSAELAREWELEHKDVRAEIEQRGRAFEKRLQAVRDELAESRKKIREEQRKGAALSKRLEARERELADARAAAVREGTGASIFAWPSHGSAEIKGAVESDGRGIRGFVTFADRPDLMPVVEVRIDGQLAAAQFCTLDHDGSDGKGWPFEIAWSRIAEQHAGKEAVVRVAGVERELGRVAVPDDLHDYHVAPAALAARVLGGTMAEAAEYHRWILESESHRDIDLARAYYANSRTDWPTITVLIFGGDEEAAATLQSLRDQVYRDWEVIVFGELSEQAQTDARVRVIAQDDLQSALQDYAPDALFTFIEAGDSISQTALLHLATAAQQSPDFALIYSDEDRVDARSGVRGLPHMKGEWSPDLALTLDYVTRLALVRRSAIGQLSKAGRASVYDIALRAALSGSGPVMHLPFVLYHRSAANLHEDEGLAEVVEAVVKDSSALAEAKVVRLASGRWKVEWPLPDPPPMVSLVVPTRDRLELLRVCVEGFLNETSYDNIEVLIADNDSEEEETKSYLAEISTHPHVRVIPCPGAFNFSRINNHAAKQAKGSVIGLMNNDLKVIDPEWLRHMVAHVVRPDVGIVGAKLLHGDDTIQHAGVTLGIGVASHLYKSFPPDAEGHHGRLMLPQDLSAVTAACLLIRRDVWDEVGGLDEDFPIAYNDVDLCLKVTARGYRVLWTPEAIVYHLESQSRGKETTPEKRERLEQEKARLIEHWGERVMSDPFHSPNLSAKAVDARLAFPPRAAPPWRPLAA